MYLKSDAHFQMTTLTQALALTDSHGRLTWPQYNGVIFVRGICPGELFGTKECQRKVSEKMYGRVNVRIPSENGIKETWQP